MNFLTTISLFLLVTASVFGQVQTPAFPLQPSANKRYFEDANKKPFLYHADTGWQLYYRLTVEEAREYLIARKKQGFTVIQTQISMDVNKVNRYGDYIFEGDNDFAKPIEAYHNHILRINQIADSLGLLVVMSQPWLGCCEESFGNRPDKPIQKNGPAKNKLYGKYLGKKFASAKNLMWIAGGDNDPKGDYHSLVAFAEGLRETAAPWQLITYHASPPHSSTDIFQHASWLGFSMIYTYWKDKPADWLTPELMPEVYEAAWREYSKTKIMPFVLGEAQYEGTTGNDIGTPHIVRRQAYWALLGGAAGHAYGSEIYRFDNKWRDYLYKNTGPGQLGYFKAFFDQVAWWQLVPDIKHKTLVAGYGQFGKADYVVGAIAQERDLFIAYLPERRTIVIDLKSMKGTQAIVEWYNPRDGNYVPSETHTTLKTIYVTPPTNEDWVLKVVTK